MAGGFEAARFPLCSVLHRLARTAPRAKEGEGAEAGGGIEVEDLFYIGLTVIFFAGALAYVRGCEKLR